MPTLGGVAINDNGAVTLNDSGAVMVGSACCAGDCNVMELGRFTTNTSNPVWDLTPWQGPGIGDPCRPWRVVEAGHDLTKFRGCIDATGELDGLPDDFTSGQAYNGYMRLEIGCLTEAGLYEWPSGSDTSTGSFGCI